MKPKRKTFFRRLYRMLVYGGYVDTFKVGHSGQLYIVRMSKRRGDRFLSYTQALSPLEIDYAIAPLSMVCDLALEIKCKFARAA